MNARFVIAQMTAMVACVRMASRMTAGVGPLWLPHDLSCSTGPA